MYLDYFGLQRHPFRITPDPSLFCPTGGRGEILQALIYAITIGEGIVKVVGEVGSGKTMLCRILEERLPKSVEVVYLSNPRLSPADILHAIAFELKLPVTISAERLVVMQQLHTYLLDQHCAQRNVVVFVEEAQSMPMDTLEEIRLLSNLETHRHKLLQIVLFGQPELDKNLRRREIRQLRERITHSFRLEALKTREVAEYLRFRLQAAGCSKSEIFTPQAERLIARASTGLVRRINILADKALLAAYIESGGKTGAGLLEAKVRPRHVRAAIRDSEFASPLLAALPRLGGAVSGLALLIALLVVWYRLDQAATPAVLSNGKAAVAEIQIPPAKPLADKADPTPPTHTTTPPIHTGDLQIHSGKLADLQGGEKFQPSSESEQQPTTVAALNEAAEPPLTAAQPVEIHRKQGVVESRHQATARWLAEVQPQHYTVQLLTADSNHPASVERFLAPLTASEIEEEIFICSVRQGEEILLVIVYGEFASITAARQAIAELPEGLRRHQPFVRSIDKLLLTLHPET
ncbi:MAG: AAA family ATPase [Desulforhopalus sp.]|jgi:type II secretory pathway predicted ATPase ExeA|nr:AAA family ATPase [Desulforhopalus sp.]